MFADVKLGNGRRLDYGPALWDDKGEVVMISMTNFRTIAAACFCIGALLALSSLAPTRAADALGTWYTGDRESQVKIVNCGGALCGNLVWLKEANDPATGRPKTDKHNADASKQSRPLLGVQIVLAMKPSGPGQWSGQVYNAEDGKTYTGSFTLTGADTADLKGCVLSILCKSQIWTRVH